MLRADSNVVSFTCTVVAVILVCSLMHLSISSDFDVYTTV
jgi:hypothetical protein